MILSSRLANILFILISGIMGIFIYPTVIGGVRFADMGYFAWVFLVPLFLIIRIHPNLSFIKSFCTSFLFYLGSLYWLALAMTHFGGLDLSTSILVLLLVVGILSAYFALAIKLAVSMERRSRVPFFVLVALFLSLQDYVRNFFPVNGFPWSMPAYSQGEYLDYFQWLQITGVHGLNVLIYLVNALVAEIIFSLIIKKRDHLISRVASLGIIVIILFSAQYLILPLLDNHELKRASTIGLIQANISQSDKWSGQHLKNNILKHVDLAVEAETNGAEIVIWPETAYPYAVENNVLPLPHHQSSIPWVVGAVSINNKNIFNTAFILDEEKQVIGTYSKQHLVPFGEYIPLKKYLTFAKQLTQAVGEFTPGNEATPHRIKDLIAGFLICYEDIFPELARQASLNGANILLNLTNDAWYGDTSAQWQHLVFSQFRALENRRYLVRATNTGVTAFINDRGFVISSIRDFTSGYLNHAVLINSGLSFYTRHGDFVMHIVFVLTLIIILTAILERNKEG